VNSNNEIQGYKMYPMLHFRRKFSSGVTASSQRKERAMLSVGIWEDLGEKGGKGILKVVIISLL